MCFYLEEDSAFKILTGTPTGKRTLGRPRYRLEDNVKMDFKETGINTGNWVDFTQNMDYCRALVNAALNLQVQTHGVSLLVIIYF